MNIAETIGPALYREARLNPCEPHRGGTIEIAARLFGPSVIILQPHAVLEATTARTSGSSRIVIRKGTAPRRANFLVGQMVARLVLEERGEATATAECRLGAWLAAPSGLFQARVHQVGADIGALSDAFAITRTSAALRLNEVTGIELAIVGHRAIHRRGPRFNWLEDQQLRVLAEKRSMKSLRKVSLREDGKAVALFAA